jgi:hypothetical protein
MTYIEAQTEFYIRLHRWAKANLDEEIKNFFSSFKFCGEWPSRTCLFLNSLDQHSKVVLGNAMLLVGHQQRPNADKVLIEAISNEAVALMQREEGFRMRTLPGTWEGRFTAANIPDKSVLATRRQLKKAIKEQFLAVYGNQCLPPDPLDGTGDMLFGMKCRGWIIKTFFHFGRWSPEITYSHNIWTGKWITKKEPAVLFANCIGFRLNYGNDIGIGSGWENIEIKNINAVCTEIIGHCRRMFDALPSLLEGLDLELLTTKGGQS